MFDDPRSQVAPDSIEVFQAGSGDIRVFEIVAEFQPEGVWLATCDEIPGLILETDSMDDLEEEVAVWGEELALDNRVIDLGESPRFIIRRAGATWANGHHSVQSGIRAFAA